jgi:hypothetical protein
MDKAEKIDDVSSNTQTDNNEGQNGADEVEMNDEQEGSELTL